MSELEQNRSLTGHPALAAAYPVNCGLIKAIAWRTLLNRDTVSEREIRALAAAVASYIRETEEIRPRAPLA